MAATDTGPVRAADRLWRLESLRGLAATYVFVHHFVHEIAKRELPALGRVFVFGQSAVMLFFVVSGFVIAYSTVAWAPDLHVRGYLVRRFRRIYPLFALALLATWAAASVQAGGPADPEVPELLGNLAMLQDRGKPGVWVSPYLSNSPLWSLSYEWFFYLAFIPLAVALRGRPQSQRWAVLCLSVAGFVTYHLAPNPISVFALYMITWWSGVELAREYAGTGRLTWRGQAFSIAAVAGVLVLLAVPLLGGAGVGLAGLDQHPLLEFRHFLTVLVVLVGGLLWYRLGFRWFGVIGWFRVFAPLSYALYIVHLPILIMVRELPLPGPDILHLIWVAPVTFGVAYLMEVRLQPLVNRLLPVPRRPDVTADTPIVAR